MSAAVLFAGQAAGDLRAAVRRLDLQAPLLAHAAACADVPGDRWLRGDLLDETRLAQPVQVAVCLTLYAARPPVDGPCVFGGHSLGALTAAAAAGALEPADAVFVAAERGRAMARVAAAHPGGLVTARMDHETLRAVLAEPWAGALALAAQNTPDQVVLAGPESALLALTTRYPGTRLVADGPWHHPVMAAAADPLRRALAGRLKAPRHPVLCGLDDRPLSDPAAIGAALVDLLTAPVDWPATCRGIARAGATRLEIVGPGRALRALMRLNLRRLPLTHTTGAP